MAYHCYSWNSLHSDRSPFAALLNGFVVLFKTVLLRPDYQVGRTGLKKLWLCRLWFHDAQLAEFPQGYEIP
jgi:hypothetical protein